MLQKKQKSKQIFYHKTNKKQRETVGLRWRYAIKHFLRLSQQQFLVLFNLRINTGTFTQFAKRAH